MMKAERFNQKITERDVCEIRRTILELCHRLGGSGAHLGGCLSLAEIIAVLYGKVMTYDIRDLQSTLRDRLIMSKGHGSIAMYAGMYRAGIIENLDDVGNLLGATNVFYKQEVRNPEKGIEFSSGSLGQGLAYAIGIAWTLKRSGNDQSRVYVIIGEGECNEGSVWEAASIASHLKLGNIVVIIDKNGLQIDGNSNDINSQQMITKRWSSFGFKTVEINGHDLSEVENSFNTEHADAPLAIIANTIKGKGVSFAEGQAEWHQNILTDELFKRAVEELSV